MSKGVPPYNVGVLQVIIMSVQDSQCAACVTEFGSNSANIALSVVQGIISLLSIIGSVLLILSYVLLKPIRSKSRLLITHLAVANFLSALPNFLAVFMNFRTKFKIPLTATEYFNSTCTKELPNLSCGNSIQFTDKSAKIYCNLCIYLEFINHIGTLSTIFWTICVCIHFFVIVSYWNTKLAARLIYAYYVIAWLVPLGISIWLLFHNWFGYAPTYSTVNCAIRAGCVPHHHPYHYHYNDGDKNWNRIIGLLVGVKIWQLLVFLLIPCLFVAIRCKHKRYVS